MKVADGQQFLLPLSKPAVARRGLTAQHAAKIDRRTIRLFSR
jgi:hypothetical protein